MGPSALHDPSRRERPRVELYAPRLEKVAQPREFDDMLGGQGRAHQGWLRRRMYLIQMPRRRRLGHELPDALIECPFEHQIGILVDPAGVVERGPFAHDGGSVEPY